MRYKDCDIITATVFGQKGTQLYCAVYVIAPDGAMTKTDSEAKARMIVDKRKPKASALTLLNK